VDARDALVAFENSRIEEEINSRKQKLIDDEEHATAALAKLKSTVTEKSRLYRVLRLIPLLETRFSNL